MSRSSGFAVSIKAVDQTAGPLDNINKRLARLAAPAERFNKALSKFGDVSGINRVSEGFGSLGRTAHDAFMSIDRVAGPLAALTSAGSIAGVAALAQRWADVGSSIGRASFRLSIPVEKLSALQGAAQRFGATADDMAQGLSGLRETLYGGAFRGEKLSFLESIGIHQAPRKVMDTIKALHILADTVHNTADAHTKLRMVTEAGLPPSLLPLVDLGSEGMDKEMQRQADLGGTVTKQMAADAIETKQRFDDLGTAIGGVANRLGNELGKAFSGYAESAAVWIGKNQDLADAIAKVGTAASMAIGALGVLKVAPWILRAMGWLLPGEAVGLVAPLLIPGDTVQPDDGRAEAWKNGPEAWKAWKEKHPGVSTWLYELGAGTPGGGAQSVPPSSDDYSRPLWERVKRWWNEDSTGGKKTPADPAELRRYFRSQGWDDPQIAGLLGSFQGESGLDAGAIGDMGAAAGLGMWRDSRRAGFRLMFGHDVSVGTPMEQAQFTQWELTHTEKAAGDHLKTIHSAREAGALVSREYARPQDVGMNAALRGQYAVIWQQKFAAEPLPAGLMPQEAPNGNVHVEVTLKGAHPGTTAKVTSSGAVTAPPPRIETPLPMVH